MLAWTRSPKLLKLFVGQHIINGLSVAAGVMAVAIASSALFGFAAGQPATLGAISASISDFPAPWRVKARTMVTGFALALASIAVIQLASGAIVGEIVAIGVIAFAAGLVTGLGRWALSLSMQMLVPVVFVLGLPPLDSAGLLRAIALLAAGGFAYIAVALALTGLVAASDRRMMASECFRELAAYLNAIARFSDAKADLAEIYGAGIRQQAALAEQLQSARALLLAGARKTPERIRLAATIGIELDVFDALVAAQSDLPQLRAAPAAQTLLARLGILLRAGALDLQHLSLDLLAHKAPRLPADHSVARDAMHREAVRVMAQDEISEDLRAAISRTMARLDSARVEIQRLERALSDDVAAEAAIGDVDLAAFRPRRSYDIRALRIHLTPASPVFRYATRLSLAMMTGAVVATALGGERHGNWVQLTIAVILRANYGLTRQRRDDRLIGTLIGCVAAAAAVAYLPVRALLGVQAFALALTHSFLRQNYRLASIGASMVALVSLHLIDPGGAAPILVRLADTIIGAAIAHVFSLFWPSWELAEAPQLARRLLARASWFASVALRPDASDQDYRLARKDIIEAVAALSDSAARMGGEPRAAQRGLDEMAAMLIAVSVFVAHVSAARLGLRGAEPEIAALVESDAADTREWLAERLAADPRTTSDPPPQRNAPLPRLRASVTRLIDATRAFEQACSPEGSD
jgi:uncharacterized membrane protein YccC